MLHRMQVLQGTAIGIDDAPEAQLFAQYVCKQIAVCTKRNSVLLKTVPNRFEFIFTPTHGSWLNIIETFFSKLTRTFLKNLRIDSIEELKNRFEIYFNEINEMPVGFKWKYKMDEISIQN